MITWLPYPNMRLSAHVLDSHTLGVQMSQSLSMLRIIAGHKEGGRNRYHASTLSWYHYPEALVLYTDYILMEMCKRSQSRGLSSPRSSQGCKMYEIPLEWSQENPIIPDWIGIESIHASHRSTLLKKDLEWYSQFSWNEKPRIDLRWPLPMPRVGDTMIGPNRKIRIVQSFDKNKSPVLYDGKISHTISRTDIYNGVWRRVIVSE